ncbi:unnamed protein product [Protopolystoma xenopodis]|uniref:Uncharacterized protein n=1 Tax=Protopolystoma xenopodis TaxID=117903 RepID=A0A448XR75_9PLAT|nr:unnamed protein product [Protopolystoma xenopodis]
MLSGIWDRVRKKSNCVRCWLATGRPSMLLILMISILSRQVATELSSILTSNTHNEL